MTPISHSLALYLHVRIDTSLSRSPATPRQLSDNVMNATQHLSAGTHSALVEKSSANMLDRDLSFVTARGPSRLCLLSCC